MHPKILLFDLETAPIQAHVWGMFKQNVGLNQIQHDTYIMAFAAKWVGTNNVYYEDCRLTGEDDYHLCAMLHTLLDEADFIVAHNLKKFDLPKLNSRFLFHGFKPPSPSKLVDTLEIARKQFGFTSNKLEWLAKHMSVSPKSTHAKFVGHVLWTECMKGNTEAWDEMKAYNIQDVITLEGVYEKLKPWAKGLHPSVAPFKEASRAVCSKCGSHEIQYRGVYRTAQNTFKRFQCNHCGAWGRETKADQSKTVREVSAV
jgi:predicted RNA-binding Zn-ribbon protein involved in translation (DUF1610 family)